jgi:ubiquinol-cytochrome c reductase cytochrome b subunit
VKRLRAIGAWFDARTGLGAPIRDAATHAVPRDTASWWYVFGSGSLTAFVLQIVTGICLATVYTPSASDAWTTLVSLDQTIPLGWFLRALHGWGSNFMVALVLVHMVQVFLFGAFKYPRELTWMIGVMLLLLTLGMAFTGQILRFDQDAYWGLGIGAAIAGRSPFIGEEAVRLMLGGPIIGAATLSRFFALHVFVIPALLIGLMGLHLFLVLKLGISEWPMPGRLVSRETYRREYEELVARDGARFFPDAAKRDIVFAAIVILSLVACAAIVGPIGPNGAPDPTLIDTNPKPDYFFLWLFAALALLPPSVETPLLLTAPIIGIGLLLALPLISATGEKSWKRRPFAVILVIVVLLTLGTLTHLGTFAPWSPVMNAWSAFATPPQYLEGRSPLELQGALIVQSKQCRNCHGLGGEGGLRGPALDGVATRLTHDQLIRQVLQGGGNMPAYGKNLSPSEVTALVAFLETLRPPGVPLARDASAAAAAPTTTER